MLLAEGVTHRSEANNQIETSTIGIEGGNGEDEETVSLKARR